MDTNVFHKVAPTPYVSMRKQLPIDEIMQTARALEDRYYKNKAMMDELDIWANQINVAPNDEYLRQQTLDGVGRTLKAVAENDGAFENSTAIINGLATEISKDRNLAAAIKNKGLMDQHSMWADEQRAHGKKVLDFSRGDFRTVNEDGTLNTYSNPYAVGLNYGDKMHEIWKGFLHEEKYGADLPDISDMSTDNPFVLMERGSGIGKNQVLRKKAAAFEQYKDTDEYHQQRRLLEHQGVPADAIDEAIAYQMDDIGNGLTYYNDDSYALNNPEFLSTYKKGMLANKGKKPKTETYSPLVSQGKTSVVSVVPTPKRGAEAIRNAATEEDKTRLTYYFNKASHEFINMNPDIKDGIATLDTKYQDVNPQAIEQIKKWVGLRGGDELGNDFSENSYDVREELGLIKKAASGEDEVGATVGMYNPEVLPLPEKLNLFGGEQSIEEREKYLDIYNDYARFKKDVGYDDRFEDQVSTLHLTDDVFSPDDPKTQRDLEYQLQRQDPADYTIIPLNAPGSYADSEAVEKAIGGFNSLQLMGVTQGSAETGPELEVKDPKTGATYRLIGKDKDANDFTSKVIGTLNPEYAAPMSRNHKYAGEVIPFDGGLQVGNVHVSRVGPDFELDTTVGDIIKEVENNVEGDQGAYANAVIELFGNQLGEAFDMSTFKLYLSNRDVLKDEILELYDGVLSQKFRTNDKGIALEYANYMN